MNCGSHYVVEVVQSATFFDWLSKLDDRRARARIQTRIDRLALGNRGDTRAVGSGMSEMADIARAIEIAEDLED